MSVNFSRLFQEYEFYNLKLHNRCAVAPMTRVSGVDNGCVGPLMGDYYTEYAKGGFGLIITEGLYTDTRYSQGYLYQPGVATSAQADSWRAIIDSVHAQGGKIFAQLMHAGALAQFNKYIDESVGPSAILPKGQQMPFYEGEGSYKMPKEMSIEDIEHAIEGFVDSARRAKDVGFDGVEIHGANGYLLDQFLTVYSNQRSDQYGGSLTNRLCIYKEILERVRVAVGVNFVVGIRFSQTKVNDAQYRWPEGEESAKHTFALVKECGADYIHTTEPNALNPAFTGSASLAALAKKYSGLTVIANGGITEPAMAEQMLAAGTCDLVAIGKIALANPDWPRRALKNQSYNQFDFAMLSPRANLKYAQEYWRRVNR